jgi:2'-hydroxyisoflavone reductase
MRMLILGGTGFIGVRHVRAAVEQGHDVSVFSRGQIAAEFPPEVEQLVGDRGGNLTLIAKREWDAVIDLATHMPIWVQTLGAALKDRVGHYTFISSIEAYNTPGANPSGTDEESVVSEYDDDEDPFSPDVWIGSRTGAAQLSVSESARLLRRYGPLKVLCEREAEKQFPSRTLVVRPGYIVGPGDPSPWLSHWLERLEQGNEVMVAGHPLMQVQLIDVRDLADWVVGMSSRGETGTYTATGPAMPMTLAEMLGAIRAATSAPATLAWVPRAWLLDRDDRALWSSVLFWSSVPDGSSDPKTGYGNMMRMTVDRALGNGLVFRPFGETVAAAREWLQKVPTDSGTRQLPVPWDEYVECEQQVIAAWRQRPDS